MDVVQFCSFIMADRNKPKVNIPPTPSPNQQHEQTQNQHQYDETDQNSTQAFTAVESQFNYNFEVEQEESRDNILNDERYRNISVFAQEHGVLPEYIQDVTIPDNERDREGIPFRYLPGSAYQLDDNTQPPPIQQQNLLVEAYKKFKSFERQHQRRREFRLNEKKHGNLNNYIEPKKPQAIVHPKRNLAPPAPHQSVSEEYGTLVGLIPASVNFHLEERRSEEIENACARQSNRHAEDAWLNPELKNIFDIAEDYGVLPQYIHQIMIPDEQRNHREFPLCYLDRNHPDFLAIAGTPTQQKKLLIKAYRKYKEYEKLHQRRGAYHHWHDSDANKVAKENLIASANKSRKNFFVAQPRRLMIEPIDITKQKGVQSSYKQMRVEAMRNRVECYDVTANNNDKKNDTKINHPHNILNANTCDAMEPQPGTSTGGYTTQSSRPSSAHTRDSNSSSDDEYIPPSGVVRQTPQYESSEEDYRPPFSSHSRSISDSSEDTHLPPFRDEYLQHEEHHSANDENHSIRINQHALPANNTHNSSQDIGDQESSDDRYTSPSGTVGQHTSNNDNNNNDNQVYFSFTTPRIRRAETRENLTISPQSSSNNRSKSTAPNFTSRSRLRTRRGSPEDETTITRPTAASTNYWQRRPEVTRRDQRQETTDNRQSNSQISRSRSRSRSK